jgi:3-hydroxymyristoyl/3-hydroxydecanoyl-(acyl carrier protein) dehydratase
MTELGRPAQRHSSTFTVPAAHPALPGHFPGSPVVPGVVVLDLVLKATSEWQRRPVSVSGLKQVKFHAPLLPDERADVALELEDSALRFRVARGEQLIAQGAFTIAAPAELRDPPPAAREPSHRA